MKIMLVSLFMFFISISAVSSFEIGHELFFRAHEAYDAGEYKKAIELYPKITNDSAVMYNLGNFYFKNGELGKAIFYFNMAKRLDPRDADISYNLNYALKEAKDKLEDKRSILTKWMGKSFCSFSDALSIVGIITILFFCLSSLMLYYQSEWMVWPRRGLGFLLLVATINLYTSYHYTKSSFGIVTVENANVYSGVGKGDIALFELHEGTSFTVDRKINASSELWYKITLIDNKQGWIKSNSIKAYFE